MRHWSWDQLVLNSWAETLPRFFFVSSDLFSGPWGWGVSCSRAVCWTGSVKKLLQIPEPSRQSSETRAWKSLHFHPDLLKGTQCYIVVCCLTLLPYVLAQQPCGVRYINIIRRLGKEYSKLLTTRKILLIGKAFFSFDHTGYCFRWLIEAYRFAWASIGFRLFSLWFNGSFFFFLVQLNLCL